MIFLAAKSVPKFIVSLKNVLDDFSSWVLYLVPAIIALALVWAGIKISSAEDGVEMREAKNRAIRIIVGTALAGSAVWLSDYLAGKFIS